jgi:hypothetical protein
MGAQTQHKARLQVGRPNARPQHKHKARSQVGRPNATQGMSARWPPKCKTHPQRKRPHKGALGLKTSWRMDKNKFWLGGRLFNMASPRLGTPTQCKARPQDGCPNATQGIPQVGRPNATQGTSASWAPQRTSATQTQGTSVTQGTSASWATQCNTRHVRKMVAQTQNSSAMKTSTQGSTRLKDELQNG